MALARKENTLKGFLREDNKGNKIDMELNVQRVKHEAAEVLRHVLP